MRPWDTARPGLEGAPWSPTTAWTTAPSDRCERVRGCPGWPGSTRPSGFRGVLKGRAGSVDVTGELVLDVSVQDLVEVAVGLET